MNHPQHVLSPPHGDLSESSMLGMRMEFRKQIKISYSLTIIGIAVEAYVTITNYIRALMFRMGGGGYTRASFSGAPRQFGFGGGIIGIVGMAIALIGAVWLGYTIAKQFKTHPKPRTDANENSSK